MSDWTWWKHGVVYQIYPRSFMDSNGDGIGDLRGVIDRLDHVTELGVDAIWLSPFYPSPMDDFGYDVADYCDVDTMFGTLDDADALIAACHERDLKLIVDFVPNHTSDQHPWFLESRSSRDNPKRDWYFWRDPKPDGSLPNNWLANFGGRTWAFDEATEQYYLHLFLPSQPDLNWRNPEVKAAMFDVLRFWLDRGVDGFRIDVAHMIMKDPELRDNPPAPPGHVSGIQARMPYDSQLHVNDKSHPDIHQVFREMRNLVDSYPDGYLVGEIAEHDLAKWILFYGDGDELHMPFNFSLMLQPWEAAAYRDVVERIEAAVPDHAWPNYVLGNHDVTRIATRAGTQERARIAMMMLLTLRGTPTLYYGDEIGLTEADIPAERVQDPWALREDGQGRDGCRTPMLWTNAPDGGFGSSEPWLPLGPLAGTTSVAAQSADPESMLALTKALMALRRTAPALHRGSYRSLDGPAGCYLYERADSADRLVIALNFRSESVTVDLSGDVVLSTTLDRVGAVDELVLGPDEGVIIRV
ncbi:MAG: alpha-amylase family glycosyl hydrolase [Acidimicrobiia bacterium]|nr:alpha-amylase family glycosyl hydrolase [Acidimicrobiia bacterium]